MLDIVSFFSDVFKVIYLPELLLSSLIILETKIKQVGNPQKKSSHRQHINEWPWLCSNKMSFIENDI